MSQPVEALSYPARLVYLRACTHGQYIVVVPSARLVVRLGMAHYRYEDAIAAEAK
jgi:hypothetical protein